ncbi:site-specific integrase [Streptococcus suis]|uniref:Site-specific integrase n=1 Tax=Streptococcus suis TaxID=1307 RepID=A0A4T2H685_STRSU|nr:site-specific integrase [Streptococcus suis]MBY4633682.1 site-specific integrase [Streptococcus suis]TII07170.1 site-specific integrase [Streptococcus suis]
MSQQTTKYTGVYIDGQGKFFYQTELGIDRITGKRIRKKGRKDRNGKVFSSASEAYKELTRIKREYHKSQGFANYRMTYKQFMDTYYIPYYKTTVQDSTFSIREKNLEKIRDRFAETSLRNISLEQVQSFRTWLLTDTNNGGSGYSQSYASLIFGMFRKSLDYALQMGYIEQNVSKRAKAIPKGKAIVPYWTKSEFEAVISTIFLDDVYEHLCFVMLWTYFMTGVRVNEGCALQWADIDLNKARIRVHHMLVIKSKSKWWRNSYTKTEDGKRMVSIDKDTVQILKRWREIQKEIGLGKENDFVFSYDGLPMLKSTISRIIKRYAKLANVKPIQAKGLRHSHASYLINEFNVSILILSRRLGHSGAEITLKHYSHMYSGADETIANSMAGNINLSSSNKSLVKFNGNQSLLPEKLSTPTNSPTKNC